MRDIVDLRNFWQINKYRKLAFCTLVRKQQSGYRAIGAKKIVAFNGASCGLLSGGCLEGEIIVTAQKRWHEMPFIESFSTLSKSDRLFGYQTGCAGMIDILFEHLPNDADMDLYLPFGANAKGAGVTISLQPATLAMRQYAMSININADNYFDPWIKPMNLYIIGCGVDATAYAELAPPLGWHLRFLDYRSDFQLPANFPYNVEIFRVDEIAEQISEGPQTAIVLMTHNYEADMIIMAGLQNKNFGYLGCLGPARRWEQMKKDLLKLQGIHINPVWERIVHAPAGIFQGRAPEEIALSVIAQIQMTLKP